MFRRCPFHGILRPSGGSVEGEGRVHSCSSREEFYHRVRPAGILDPQRSIYFVFAFFAVKCF